MRGARWDYRRLCAISGRAQYSASMSLIEVETARAIRSGHGPVAYSRCFAVRTVYRAWHLGPCISGCGMGPLASGVIAVR